MPNSLVLAHVVLNLYNLHCGVVIVFYTLLQLFTAGLLSLWSVRRGDVLAAWSGIRPLVRDPKAKNTQSIARNHIIDVSPSDLITIAGGKWTTYRSMAEETIDEVVKVGHFSHATNSKTNGMKLVGSDCYHPTFFITLIQDYGLDEDVSMTVRRERRCRICVLSYSTTARLCHLLSQGM